MNIQGSMPFYPSPAIISAVSTPLKTMYLRLSQCYAARRSSEDEMMAPSALHVIEYACETVEVVGRRRLKWWCTRKHDDTFRPSVPRSALYLLGTATLPNEALVQGFVRHLIRCGPVLWQFQHLSIHRSSYSILKGLLGG